MKEVQAIIRKAQDEGRTSLSEHESKNLLRVYGIPTTREVLVDKPEDLPQAIDKIINPPSKWVFLRISIEIRIAKPTCDD